MNALKKYQKCIACILLVAFSSYLFSGCSRMFYKPVDSEMSDTERISDTEEKTGKKKYDYKLKQKPQVEDPTVNLKVDRAHQYKIQTKKRIRERTIFGNIYKYVGPFFVLGSLPYAFVEYEGGNKYPEMTIFGVLFYGIPWIYGMFGKDLYKKDYQTFYKDFSSLPNAEVSINASSLPEGVENTSITRQTDNKGMLKYSLTNDFDITKSKNNEPVTFELKTNQTSFERPLKLKPSLWMHKYAKINTSESKIYDFKESSSEQIGTARKNMEYKVLSDEDNNYKVELFRDKAGWINKSAVETYYSVPKEKDIAAVIKSYVEEKMDEWLQQGEFESPEEYKKRMMKKDEQLNKFTEKAISMYQQDYIDLINWEDATISKYDPNSETFKVDIPDLKEIIISVPIEKAEQFKENWDKVTFDDRNFSLVDGQWELSSLNLVNPEMDYTVTYNSKIKKNYNPANQFAFDLESVDVDISEQETEEEAEAGAMDRYSINTNLPETSMEETDDIAVVIGNANYSSTEDVKYAVNDAQLMKVYLDKVLGFKPGNIIFVKNATKGELEGLFGTRNNPEGKLNSYVKEGISDVFVYYSGHGAPGMDNKEPYLLPVDCDPNYVKLQGYPLENLYDNLGRIPAKSTTVVLDACFSGQQVLENRKAIVPEISAPEFTAQSGILFTSSEGTQASYSYNEKQHSLFTYYFLKAIKDRENSDANQDGKLTYQEIYQYVSDKTEGVPYISRRKYGSEQTPTIMGSGTEEVFVEY